MAKQTRAAAHALALHGAACTLARELEAGRPIDARVLRTAMERATGGSDVTGEWRWKDAYEASEAGAVLLVRRYGRAMGIGGRDAAAALKNVASIVALEPAQTRRTEAQVRLQQFSTPLTIALAVATAADVQPDDVVLEPSAGTGILAAMAELALEPKDRARLVLNELAAERAELLRLIFAREVSRHDGERIHDLLPHVRPSLVVMNPPFSRRAQLAKRHQDADLRHVLAAYAALAPGGRLVAITSEGCDPGTETWRQACRERQLAPHVGLTVRIAGRLYQNRGTAVGTRLTVMDRPEKENRRPAAREFPRGHAWTPEDLIRTVSEHARPRLAATGHVAASKRSAPAQGTRQEAQERKAAADERRRRQMWEDAAALEYGDNPSQPEHEENEKPYTPWQPSTVHVVGAHAHPTKLMQSAAMAAIAHRRPSARPLVPARLVREGALSDAQLESVALAAEAHDKHLPATYQINATWDRAKRADGVRGAPSDEAEEAEARFGVPVRLRQGWMLGDGTGCGKGRQVAAAILDQWLRGRRRALWLSQSDKLIEDARRDWRALGGADKDIIQLNRIRPGDDIVNAGGILFCTYATLRSKAGGDGGQSRLEQIVRWLAGGDSEDARRSFAGVIVFDEAHAMANAAGGKGTRGEIAPSQQGRAGLRLQNALPDARILYVSATGASSVEGLAYATRLGLWATERTPFEKRDDFVAAMDSGGVAALEVVARDLKSFGLYQARALSFDGIEIDILTHELADEQRAIYDEYANAFKIIHGNIHEALELTGITEDGETRDVNAKAAAMSAFESAKQRFFGHLLTSMKCPTLIAAIEGDLEAGRSAVVQLVSTGQALTDRRLAEMPASEWDDVRIDCTPREYVIEFLRNGFPTQLFEQYSDEEGNELSRPVYDKDGHPVISTAAIRQRDELIERLCAMPPVPAALDQIVQHFGHDAVAEITGRSRRIVRVGSGADEHLAVQPRPDSANTQETHAFMERRKRIAVFSLAGNTGRSYHADLDCENQDRRYHYLLEAGWRADQAIQGLGRTHRTHQRCAPMFRPVSTNVKGERRFISTIVRRLDALGALTRGQRDSQTAMGDRNTALFNAADNFESPYAVAALRQFYNAIYTRAIPNWSVARFETETGLKIVHGQELRKKLPPMAIFLNRLLALPIDEQNELFAELEVRIEANIQEAVDNDTLNQGVEQIRADALEVGHREIACVHHEADADTMIVEVRAKHRIEILDADSALELRAHELKMGRTGRLLVNTQSGRAALAVMATVRVLESGAIQRRMRLLRPTNRVSMAESELRGSRWQNAPERQWRTLWDSEAEGSTGHRTTRFWLVTGLLLPIWRQLEETDMKVYRLTTDSGEKLIGRVLNPAEVRKFRTAMALDPARGPQLSGVEIHNEVRRHGSRHQLVNGWRISGRSHMGARRVEIEGPRHTALEALKRLGCTTEIVSYNTRVFVPDAETMERLLERYPLATDETGATTAPQAAACAAATG